jgi:Flp pilus assembly protein TadG
MTRMLRRARDARGQSLLEFSLVLPLLIVIVLGVIEVSYALLDQHVVTKLTREGSNLISRDTSLQDATTALRSMSTRPVDFAASATLILSVVKMVDTAGAANFNKEVLYQRYAFGALGSSSALTTRGAGAFGGAPDYQAVNPDTDINLQLTNLPANLVLPGGLLYITEIYSRHPLITPLDRFGISVPNTLYSIAYF